MSLMERLQDLKDMVVARKLGYVRVKNLEGIPESQKLSSCYCPISCVPHSDVYKELKTKDYMAFAVTSMKKNNPQFEGLIFEPMPGLIADVKKVMQMYANEYHLPIAAQINSKIEVIEPVKDNPKNNAIINQVKDRQQHT